MLGNVFSRLKGQDSQSLMQAQRHFDKGVRLSAEGHYANAVMELKLAGAAYDELGQFVNALKVYMKAIMLAPHDPDLRNDLGLVYFNIGSYAEAIKAFKQVLEMDSHNARAHYCLGLVYLDLGDIQMALAEREQLSDEHLAFDLLERIQLQSRQAS
jgi:tetratricopeptide (TPR) repeat protein